ncbi:SDR family oxidoreductase [Legionella oakridgensis]|uniref:NAD-dependent epimerase/dehydratase n=1 Tax=Legionella oakridgensis TaxID=29423 RepID=A0A0W0X344_9GAMM|nr:SDR family oxidoreductase [Legionella oakridgensis]ETO92202.1 NAD dependent epimerase/dehydratase family [Legionella oakridgensis RV-2-2007]KTD38989.1 NAD-dependent epimerase/dehydratase [Legionella oakridgensis]STY21283.1 oxidoreductase (NAD-dependent epimerase/dehydratase) [Legionella longbeachae]
MNPSFFIFGFGYTANILAKKLTQLGLRTVGTTRQQRKKTTDDSSAIKLIDFETPEIEHYLSQSTHLLVSIPPLTGAGDSVLLKYADLIKRHAFHIEWLGYFSSTSVYGDHQGNWVDETSACKPHSLSGILRLKTEQAWLSYAKANQLPLHIFRLAGIYGPERNILERIHLGKQYSIFKEGQVFSRIHVDDIVSVLLASIQAIHPLSIYNIADDEPEASHVIDAYAAFLLQRSPLPLVPFEKASLSAMELEFYSNNRRVSNLKIKNELNIALQYPSFREGLTQLWKEKENKQRREMRE